MGVAEKRVGTAPLCFECGGKGHYDVVCTIKGLHFCIEKLEPELKADQKEAQSHNKMQLGELTSIGYSNSKSGRGLGQK